MSFRFPCYRELKQHLGELDALCECIEVAARDLIERTNASTDQSSFIRELAQRHGVRVDRVDVPAMQPHVARIYIATVHQCLEEFLIGLREEHPKGKSWHMGDDEDRLTKIARALGFKATLAYDLCQYYRTVRNATMHPKAREKARKTGVDDDLRARAAAARTMGKLAAPNAFDTVTFDDFVLFTRSAKVLAEELCIAARPPDDELAALVVASTAGMAGKFRNDAQRLKNARSGFLQTNYSLPKAEADRIAAAC
jgi:hypothetical protein